MPTDSANLEQLFSGPCSIWPTAQEMFSHTSPEKFKKDDYFGCWTGHLDNRIFSCWSYVSNNVSSKLQTVYMSMCPAAFHITIIELFTPAWCWSQHSWGVMTPFSHFFPPNPGTSVLASLSSAPARFWAFKIMRTPSGNLLFVGIHGDFLFRKQCGDSNQNKKWVTVRERPPWQVQRWILERQHKNTQQTCQVSLIWGTAKLMLPSWMSVVS